MNVPFSMQGRTSAAPAAGIPRGNFGQASTSASSMKWAALQEAGNAVAILAGLPPERTTPAIRNFPVAIRDTNQQRRVLVENGIEDLSAIMEPGLAALLAVQARGIDGRAAALALWREFKAARDGLLALAPSGGSYGPRRSA